MTPHVVDCRSADAQIIRREPRPRQPDPRAGFGAALLVAVAIVPFAGAAERPLGWLACIATAIAILGPAAIFGQRVRWGWLCVIAGLAGLVVPRGPYAVIGPVLFVSWVLCGVLWLAGRAPRRRRTMLAATGLRELRAQQLAGRSGELHVGRVLARDLPSDYTLINGLKLPRGSGDIDHLVVGPTGIFLLETKTMAGQIVCAPDGTWRRTKIGRGGTPYEAFIGDPARQVQRNIHAVRDCLQRRCPGLCGRNPVWIEGLVVFPHPRAELQAEWSRVPAVRLEHVAERIVSNIPRRRIGTDELSAIVTALVDEGRESPGVALPAAQSAQSMVEVALALPIVLALLFGTVAISRVIRAQSAVIAVAHEAARAGALSQSPDAAAVAIQQRAQVVSPGFALDPRSVTVDSDLTRFGADPGRVSADVRYTVDLTDLPLAGWAPAIVVRAQHVEFVDPFRSGVAGPRP